MSASFEQLIHEREPIPLIALHLFKIVILTAPLLLIMFLVAPLLGLRREIWGYLLLASLFGSIVSALLANRWSKVLFVRRAKESGLDPSEARHFYLTHDWDSSDAED
jgi:hypothetical protein